ncbi:branched-chain amino acid transporter permease [Aedoeadaptatus coli]|uniref:branched-chain amino acid transporter permease n=1 Tax=Aedoeadaptatus coli TaxID=2058292 RepID=UPI000D55B369|nr:AzlD domain-containing protein [Peptoniphilus coli]
MSTKEVYIAIAIAVAITFFIRMFPLFFFSNRDTIPKIVKDLGVLLPYSMMGLLIIYCLRSMRFDSPAGFVPLTVASLVTAGSYLWKRKSILSIVLGTAVYMFLIQQVFVG